ncbi:MAG: helix-turn-helix transcriptional regulator [Rikenellaceae bacterium]|nr:helix-turn-helix transcriptional regulator [Rikenellaceae bacterium]
MKKMGIYRATDTMRDLIKDNSQLLMVINRFGISLGFGEKSVEEICKEQSVDTETFLAVANFISGYAESTENLSIPSLINYLKRAHTFFLDYNLPTIRRRLIDSIDYSDLTGMAQLIIKFYDEYVAEVRRHMEYEDNVVFSYVEGLLEGILCDSYTIQSFANKHNHIEPKLNELKNIIINYYPERGNDQLTSVLFDIVSCERDLSSHCQVEDCMFVPAVELLEEEILTKGYAHDHSDRPIANGDNERLELLSSREKDIVVCVARGLSNKEIADHLNLSIHTVATHRRNIAAKLQIHSTAGLTIYAIANKLVDLKDIKL